MQPRCTAKARTTGNRCKAYAITGATVCRMHGGSAPQVKEAARRRILELVMPALVGLTDLLHDPDTPPATKLAAVRDILDRAGFKPVQVSEVTHITEDALDREIARLEAELADSFG